MTNSKHVPKRRFKEFELDDEWEQLKLGDHANILTGGTPNTSISSYWEPKEIPWMSSGEVNRKRLDKTDNMISNDGIRNSSARWVKKHSILIALAGQGKTRGMVAVNNIPLTTNQSVAAIEPDKTLNYEFVFQNLSKRYDELRLISSGDGSRGGLNKQIVSDISIACPNVNEQELIGNFLADFDSLITMNQHKLDKLKNLKKAYLSEMFPAGGERVPKRRFPGFEGEWEQMLLGKIGKAQSGIGFPDSEQGGKVGIPFYKVSDMNNNGNEHEMVFANNYVTLEQMSQRGWKAIHDVPAIFFAKVGAAVLLNRKRLCRVPFLMDNNTMAFSLDTSKVDTNFAKTMFETVDLTSLVQIGALPSYNTRDVESISVLVPATKEQKQIGDFFHKLDNSISLQKQKLDKLNDLKKAYLNELFV